MSKNTGIAKEVEKLLVDGGMTFDQLKDRLILDGESTKPLQDALYRLQKSGVIVRQDGGLIVMTHDPVQVSISVDLDEVQKMKLGVDNLNESIQSIKSENERLSKHVEMLKGDGTSQAEIISNLENELQAANKIFKSLNTEVKSQAGTIARLEDELESANENAKNFACQLENIKKLNSEMDSVFGAIHNFLDTTGIGTNRTGHVLDRIKQLVEKNNEINKESSKSRNELKNIKRILNIGNIGEKSDSSIERIKKHLDFLNESRNSSSNNASLYFAQNQEIARMQYQLSSIDKVFADINKLLDSNGIEKGIHVVERIKFLAEKNTPQGLGYIVSAEYNITHAATLDEAISEAETFAKLMIDGGEILISKTIKIGTIPKKSVEWSE